MNKIEFSKTNKRAAIVGYNTRLTLSSKHIRSTGIAYMREYILNILGREECDILSIPHSEDSDRKYYKDIRDFESGKLDINYYEEIFIYNCQTNAFGGCFPVPAIPTLLSLINYKGDLWYMLTDPSMPPINAALFVRQKQKFCSVPDHNKVIDGTIKQFTEQNAKDFTRNVFERTKVAFCGLDYKKYYDLYNPEKRIDTRKIIDVDWAYFGQHEYYTSRDFIDLKLQTPNKDSDAFDFVYCGNKRASRDKLLKAITSYSDINCATVGYGNSISGDNVTNYDYMGHAEMFDFINKKAYSTIVMGDILHNDNIITPRFYESMLLNVVAFIWNQYDSEKKFVSDDELKKFIYISSAEELHNKIKQIKNDTALFRKLVDLERKEALSKLGISDVEKFIQSTDTDILKLKRNKGAVHD